MLDHDAAVLYHLDARVIEALGECVVADAELEPDGARVFLQDVIEVRHQVARFAKDVHHVDVAWDVCDLAVDWLPEDRRRLRVVDRHGNDLEPGGLHVARDVVRGLTRLGFCLDAEHRDAPGSGEERAQVHGQRWYTSRAPVIRTSLLLFLLLLGACGGPSSKVPTTAPADAGAEAAPLPSHLVSTLPTDVKSPPPFNLGSKHAQRRAHDEWSACHANFHPSGDPTKAVDALGQACAGATQMHAGAAPVMSGTQSAISSPPITYRFHGQAKHCYRLYGVAGAAVKSLVAVVTDADGASIAEYHTDDVSSAIAPDEALCFVDDADAQVTVSVGIGDGAYALSLWGN